MTSCPVSGGILLNRCASWADLHDPNLLWSVGLSNNPAVPLSLRKFRYSVCVCAFRCVCVQMCVYVQMYVCVCLEEKEETRVSEHDFFLKLMWKISDLTESGFQEQKLSGQLESNTFCMQKQQQVHCGSSRNQFRAFPAGRGLALRLPYRTLRNEMCFGQSRRERSARQ